MTIMEGLQQNGFEQLPDEQDLLRVQTDSGEISVVASRSVAAEEDRVALWEMIETGFAALNSRSFEQQSMAFDEFLNDIESPNVLKYIARDESGKPVGYLTAHLGIDDISWINRDLLRTKQDELDLGAPSIFVGTLVVSPEQKESEAIPTLIHGALEHFRMINETTGRNSLCFFDCAQANYPWLARYLESLSKPSGDFAGVPVTIEEIGVEYWAEDLTTESLETSGHMVRKLTALPEDEVPNQYHILDAQHIYAMQLLPEPQGR